MWFCYCCSSVAQSCSTLCDLMDCSKDCNQASLSFTVSQSLVKLMSIESVMPSNHLALCHPLLLLLSIFSSIRVFLMGQPLASGGQSIGASSTASVLPMNIQFWSPLGLTGWIPLQSKGLSRVFFSTTAQRHQLFSAQPSLWYNSHFHTLTIGKTIALTRWTLVSKVMSLFFNMLSRFVIAFLPKSKCLNFMAAVTIYSEFGAHKNKIRCLYARQQKRHRCT